MKNKIELTSDIKYQLLRDISYKIRGTLDLDEILNLILDLLSNVIDYDAAGIFILSEDVAYQGNYKPTQKIVSMVQRGFGNIPIESDGMLMEGRGIVGQTIKTGKSIILNDVRTDKRYLPGRKETLSELTCPITRDGKTIGALNVESDRLAAYEKRDIEILNFFAEAAAISIDKALLHYQIIEKKKIEEQLQIAKDVQLGLLPSAPPLIKNYDFADLFIPTFEIGGDYFDYIRIDEYRLGIVIADVSGDGIPAALIMAAFRALLRYNARLNYTPAQLVKLMNDQVAEFIRKRDFISVFYGELDLNSNVFTYCNCGHNPAIVLKSDKRIQFLGGNGPSLNLLKDADFNSDFYSIEPGDQLLFYTDGVVEVFSENRSMFGLDRLKIVLSENAELNTEDIISKIVGSIKKFRSSDFFDDDFTLVLMRRKS